MTRLTQLQSLMDEYFTEMDARGGQPYITRDVFKTFTARLMSALTAGEAEDQRVCRGVFTANVALSGVQNPDGLTGAAGETVLLVGQTSAIQNGAWVMAAGAWARAAWANSNVNVVPGMVVKVLEGTTYSDSLWVLTTDSVNLGVSNLDWEQFSGSGLAAGGDLSGTYPNPVVDIARGLRTTTGPTELTMGAVADGQFLKRDGTSVVGAAAATVNEYVSVIVLGTVTNSHTYTVYLRGAGDVLLGTATYASDGSATSQEIQEGIRDAINALGVGVTASAVRGGSGAGYYIVRVVANVAGTVFTVWTNEARLGFGNLIQGKSFQYAQVDPATYNATLYFSQGAAYETGSPATTYADMAAAATTNRLAYDAVEGVRNALNLSTTDLPDGVWRFEGTFAWNGAGGESLYVWRHPGGSDAGNQPLRNDYVLGNYAEQYNFFHTDSWGRMWCAKNSANANNMLCRHLQMRIWS